ncbi:hypothetical protein [Flavisphingomonas formosensis]|uniref:hypothetical protein n=1 Tax=Flavisphingomonas formosensis TaxID=861534 RepID=UPI0012FC7632|nr:hypothetical protein [Sphingomonas formosensis]
MIGWAVMGLALGSVQPGDEMLAQNARCVPVFTLMGGDLQQQRGQQRVPLPGEAPAAGDQQRRDERPRLRPCLHLANG